MKLEKTRNELNELLSSCGLSDLHDEILSEEGIIGEVHNAVMYASTRVERGEWYRAAFQRLVNGLFLSPPPKS